LCRGIDVTATADMMKRKLRRICRIYDYCKRLEGGHSGMDIHKGLGSK
jgi:di/tripeptidase